MPDHRFYPILGVSIHAPARGATPKHFAQGQNITVSIHAPARGATHRGGGSQRGRSVSIHAPARGATWFIPGRGLVLCCFNPRTREGCDPNVFQSTASLAVSIHAPARGATGGGDESVGMCSPCFNPRTREGCDGTYSHCRGENMKFQSTHPRGVRLSAAQEYTG